ncbi:hypothetical protein AGLY_007787 [Aphis glycines]|uniref:Transmembrane protein n=1 Tax=Aphis glycines TaxID=307491 RepID=A0A6G0TQ96_APHGL|nr:hypothetical protein AGLY_007787 [Aphis glycines]
MLLRFNTPIGSRTLIFFILTILSILFCTNSLSSNSFFIHALLSNISALGLLLFSNLTNGTRPNSERKQVSSISTSDCRKCSKSTSNNPGICVSPKKGIDTSSNSNILSTSKAQVDSAKRPERKDIINRHASTGATSCRIIRRRCPCGGYLCCSHWGGCPGCDGGIERGGPCDQFCEAAFGVPVHPEKYCLIFTWIHRSLLRTITWITSWLGRTTLLIFSKIRMTPWLWRWHSFSWQEVLVDNNLVEVADQQVKNSVVVAVQETWVVVDSQMVVELVHVHMDLDHCQVPEEWSHWATWVTNWSTNWWIMLSILIIAAWILLIVSTLSLVTSLSSYQVMRCQMTIIVYKRQLNISES